MCESKSFNVWLLQFLALLGLLVFILWLTLRPKDPSYTIVDFSLPTLNSSNSTSLIDQNNQNGTVSYSLLIENPNEDSGIYYDDIYLTFYHGQDTVGGKTIPSFYQGKDRTLRLFDHVDAKPGVWRALVNAISNATAELKVGLITRIRYRTWGIKSKHHGMNLLGRLSIGSDGKISGKRKKVKLRRASKKWRLRVT